MLATTRLSIMFCSVITLAGCSADNARRATPAGTSGTSANPVLGLSGSPALIGMAGGGAAAASGSSGKGAAANSGASAPAATGCPTPGATRSCCPGGTQTCSGGLEFAFWGPCLDSKGVTLTCSGTCADNEFGKCDAGVDSGNVCGENEFGPGCDAGMPKLCTDESVSNEPEILAAYSPANGKMVSENGQIKVWINDERAAIIAPNEQIDPMSGLITAPGDRTAKAPDGYLWEPALYIAPQTAENGGTPHFPQAIKGWYNNNPPANGGRPPNGAGVQVPGMDPPPNGTKLPEKYTTEDIWDVSQLGLPPGTYIGEFVIHDGDRDRAVGCVTIVIVAVD
jgi:hypothetical protein